MQTWRPRPGSVPTLSSDAASSLRTTAVPLVALLLALHVNRRLEHAGAEFWILVPLGVAAALARARFIVAEMPVVRLLQLVGAISALYALFHYPLLPMQRGDASTVALYATLLAAWLLSVAAGVLCWRVPSLALLPAAFLLWADAMAGRITGLPTTIHIDVQPLTEVAICIGFGLLATRLTRSVANGWWRLPDRSTRALDAPGASTDTGAAFARLLLLLAVAVHLANYYWSFRTKMSLGGPAGSWVTENNPASMFLTALDDDHILFAGNARLVAWIHALLDTSRVEANAAVLLLQAAAAVAFFLPKRALVALLLLLDAMHAAIIVIVGANFWPWILLNLAVAFVLVTDRGGPRSLAARSIATAFVLFAPHFIQVTRLGWYDSGANNKIYFEAVDETGRRYAVPTNFFTFYSYSLGHMDYGSPDAASAFSVGSPNGSTEDLETLRAARRCDVQALTRPGHARGFDADALTTFVRNYQRLALAIRADIGAFPYDLYPHHFYTPSATRDDFRQLDLRRIVAYVYRRESVCLSFDERGPQRRVVATSEFRIDVDPAALAGHANQGMDSRR